MNNNKIILKNIRELYPNENDMFFCISDYQPLIESFGNILIKIADADYQGDTRVLYEKDRKYGYLIFGWGSCSGCDALQSCRNYNDVLELANQLQNDIKWFDSLNLLKKYFKSKDWELDWSYHCREGKEFINEVINYIPDANE